MTATADFGLIGLAVMGENLALNLAGKGFTVAVYNRTAERVDKFLSGRGQDKNFVGCHSPEELCAALKRPRKIMLMVKAGAPVDDLIAQLTPLLEPNDILIDGGNSHYTDTVRRCRETQAKGLRFVGCGVSGGEEGALHGPSLMPGGEAAAWPELQPILTAVAAKGPDGQPCCDWVGPDGAGHFVKMVHNGIEYGDMQMCSEAYLMLRDYLHAGPAELHDIFAAWNQTGLSSYLIEITADIFARQDTETGRPLVEMILDAAGQKGTGKWTGEAALELAAPTPTLAEAVFARSLSALKSEREDAARILTGGSPSTSQVARKDFIEAVRMTLYAAKICSYAQGFQLLRLASDAYRWDLKLGGIAMLWRNGCIIRAAFLDKIREAFDLQPNLPCLLLNPFFRQICLDAQNPWRLVAMTATWSGIPVPTFASALAWYDGYRNPRLGANLIQAQRDYFGAHTYERIDRPRGEFFHTDWTSSGGATAGSYNA